MQVGKHRGITTITAGIVVIVIIVVAGIAAAYYVTRPTPPKAPSTINIGSVQSVTGVNSLAGAEETAGLKFWAQYVNNEGGLYIKEYNAKIPINLIILDDQSNPSNDPALVQQLVSTDNVTALVGATLFTDVSVIVPIAERTGIPFVTPWNMFNSSWRLYSSIDPTPKYAFWVWPSQLDLANIVWSWINTLPASSRPTTVAANYVENYGFDIVANQFTTDAVQNGASVVLPTKSYPIGVSDLTSLVTQLKAANPDVVFSNSLPPDGILMLKEAEAMGYSPKLWIQPATGESSNLANVLGSYVNGLVSSTTWSHLLNINVSSQLNSYYQSQAQGAPAPAASANEAAAFQVLTAGIEAAGSLSREAIANAMASPNFSVQTVEGVVQFDSYHNTPNLPAIILQWQNETLQVVWPVAKATAPFVYPSPNYSGS